jgi:hypothetical protein
MSIPPAPPTYTITLARDPKTRAWMIGVFDEDPAWAEPLAFVECAEDGNAILALGRLAGHIVEDTDPAGWQADLDVWTKTG